VSALVGALCGLASAGFLAALARVTAVREGRPALVAALPLAGLALGWAYERWGAPVRGGYDRVLVAVHDGGAQVAARMAPMALLGTLASHLFGASVGREGTAVQMGAALADLVTHRLKLEGRHRRALLLAGVAGGFGAVFGTPLAGAVFALESPRSAHLETRDLATCLLAALVGDGVVRALGVQHTLYPRPAALALSPLLAAKWVALGLAVGAAVRAYLALVGWLRHHGARALPSLPWRLAAGGIAVVALWRLAGTDAYLGLSLPVLARAFTDPGLPWTAFAWKLAFTAVSLGAGFVGGEVTPLFVMGAALGNAAARVLGLPLDLAAGAAMAAMFGAASRAPLALVVMAAEVIGAAALPHAAVVVVTAWLCRGERGLYAAQRA
jgi:H+/Cl- antiporter ClcA